MFRKHFQRRRKNELLRLHGLVNAYTRQVKTNLSRFDSDLNTARFFAQEEGKYSQVKSTVGMLAQILVNLGDERIEPLSDLIKALKEKVPFFDRPDELVWRSLSKLYNAWDKLVEYNQAFLVAIAAGKRDYSALSDDKDEHRILIDQHQAVWFEAKELIDDIKENVYNQELFPAPNSAAA